MVEKLKMQENNLLITTINIMFYLNTLYTNMYISDVI